GGDWNDPSADGAGRRASGAGSRDVASVPQGRGVKGTSEELDRVTEGLCTFEGFIADKSLITEPQRAWRQDRPPAASTPCFLSRAHRIGNLFCKLKKFKRVAMRADKT